MFVLLGDPALRLPEMASDIRLLRGAGGPPVDQSHLKITPGESFVVYGRLPERLSGATVRITLERPAASMPENLQAPPKPPGPHRDRVMLENHRLANRFAIATKEVKAKGMLFTARLEVPAKLPWPELILRVYASTAAEEGMMVERLRVIRP